MERVDHPRPNDPQGSEAAQRKLLERNLNGVAAFQAAAFGYAAVPFLIFLTASRGLSLGDYATLQSIYYTTTLLTDVPTGLLADRIGRKPVLALAAVAQAAGFVAIARADGFVSFALGEVLLGLGQAMLSGTTAALLYDSLHSLRRTDEYLKYETRSVVARLGGTSVAFLIGGIVATFSGLEATAWVSAAASVIALPIALLLHEPARQNASAHSRSVLLLLKHSVSDLLHIADLRWIAVVFTVFFVATRLAFHFYTPELERAGVGDFIIIGSVYSFLNVVAAVSTRFAPRASAAMGWRGLLILLLSVLSVTFAIHAVFHSPAATIACFVLQQIPFGMHFPLVAGFVNSRVSSDRRATLLSCLSLLGRAAFAAFFPAIGAMAVRDFSLAMWTSAGIFIIITIALAAIRPKQSS